MVIITIFAIITTRTRSPDPKCSLVHFLHFSYLPSEHTFISYNLKFCKLLNTHPLSSSMVQERLDRVTDWYFDSTSLLIQTRHLPNSGRRVATAIFYFQAKEQHLPPRAD